MKIAIFTEIFDCGGVDTFIVNLINHWPHAADSFIVMANSNYPGLQLIEENASRPCEIIRHNTPVFSNFLGNGLFSRKTRKLISPVARYLFILYNIFAFRKLLLQKNPDALMIINGGYPGGDSCRAAGISWGIFSGKPYSVHNFHNIVWKPHWSCCLQEHLVDFVLCRFTTCFVTVSRAAANSMSLRPTIEKKNKTIFIHNGLGEKLLQPDPALNVRDEIGISPTAPLCLMLGTYEPRKGHRFLFQAFKKVLQEISEAHLLICGFGFPHEIKQVQRCMTDLNLEKNVHLMDFRPDLSHLLSQADILVVASQAYESFGYTSIEAMAHYVPVVATNIGGIPEVVVNDEGGYCVDSRDVDSYARCIINLLKDKNLRLKQGEKGYARYRAHFTAERMSRRYAEIIHEIYG
ncbi:MAG: glycosyltransferase family 4 protein [Candidatus Omnitrophota bacterium]